MENPTNIFVPVKDSDELYHANREFIGSTELREMDRSPLHFFRAWKERSEKATKGMVSGRFKHSIILDNKIDKFCARPVKENGELIRSNSQKYKDFLAENAGKTPIEPVEYHSALGIMSAFHKNQTASDLLRGALVERSVYARDPGTNLPIKARFDALNGSTLIDLKSTSKRLNSSFEKSIFQMGYDIQMAHYAETILAAGGPKIERFIIIAIEQGAPYGIKFYELDMADVESAVHKRRLWLNEISVCLEENAWPSYSQEIKKTQKPMYLIDLDSEMFAESYG